VFNVKLQISCLFKHVYRVWYKVAEGELEIEVHEDRRETSRERERERATPLKWHQLLNKWLNFFLNVRSDPSKFSKITNGLWKFMKFTNWPLFFNFQSWPKKNWRVYLPPTIKIDRCDFESYTSNWPTLTRFFKTS